MPGMQNNMGTQPILVLPEGSMRTFGKDAQRINISAARAVADSVRTTLGPKGMDKMLVDSMGDVVITNDGVTILEQMEIEHPAAKMVVEVAKTQNDEVGDGTTTAVVVTGELLKRSESLLDQEIHPSVIIRGFRMAKKKSLEILNDISKDINIDSTNELERIAMTAMTGKGSEAARDFLATIAVDAVKTVAREEDGKTELDSDNIKLEKAVGGSIDDTELIRGIVIDKERVHSSMPTHIKDAKIALLDVALEVKETETDAEIRITSPEQLQAFLDSEAKMLKDMVDRIAASGTNVVFVQKGMDEVAQHYLAKKGILAARRVKKSDMEKLSKATGGKIISNLEDLEESDLGFAGVVEEKRISGNEMIFVKDCRDPKAVTILVRGGTEHVVAEAERAMDDAVRGVIAAIEVGKVVTGGGAVEVELSRQLREYADTVGGREQLAITAFADSLEIIPRTLSESSGLDAIDTLVELRSQHENGNTELGVDVIHGKLSNMWELGVAEPLKIKTQAIKSAGEVTEMILRIDDVITANRVSPGMGMGGHDHLDQ